MELGAEEEAVQLGEGHVLVDADAILAPLQGGAPLPVGLLEGDPDLGPDALQQPLEE